MDKCKTQKPLMKNFKSKSQIQLSSRPWNNMKSFSPFLEVKDLKKKFPSKKFFLGKDVNPVRAVDGISFVSK